ncbi:hypothetical protein HII12_002767, partial [Brettanomyces bruxellensis]
PLLVHPIWDRDYTFRIHTDACGTALGYVLEQLDPEGKVRGVIAYGSKKLLPAQMRYSIYEREFLAIVEALKTWRYYLMDKKFIIQTDHRSLKYVKYQNSMSQMRVAKWLDFLTRFDFEIEYIKGKTNTAADSLSRYPNLSLLKPMDDSEVTLASIAYFDLSAVLKKAAVDQQLATLTDGQTERVNQILDTLIRELARNALNDWDKILPMAEFAYNSAIQNSTGYSPFYVAQGYNPDSPAHISADIIDSNRYSPRAEDFCETT